MLNAGKKLKEKIDTRKTQEKYMKVAKDRKPKVNKTQRYIDTSNTEEEEEEIRMSDNEEKRPSETEIVQRDGDR
jgi:hypothetical protein